MKTAEYKLPFGVHPLLEPVQIGQEEPVKDKAGKVVKEGKPIYSYRTVSTPESETLDEFVNSGVFVDPAHGEELTRSEAQGQNDIKRQRVIREWCSSQECSDLIEGKGETADMDEDERIEYVLSKAQEIGDSYKLGLRSAGGGGGGSVAAKQALAREKALVAAAARDPEIAARKAELDRMLADLGVTV